MQDNLSKNPDTVRIVYDCGNGWQEECPSAFSLVEKTQTQALPLPKDTVGIRVFLPHAEGALLTTPRFLLNEKEIFPVKYDGLLIADELCIVLQKDAFFQFSVSQDGASFSVMGDLSIQKTLSLPAELIPTLTDISARIALLQSHMVMETELQRATAEELEQSRKEYFELEEKCENLAQNLDTLSTSTSWRLTKPLRFVLDCIKKVIRRIPFLRLFFKGIRYATRFGFRAAWRKMRDRKIAKRVSRKPLYTQAQLEAQRKHVFPEEHLFSILVPLYNTPEKFLLEMINSVKAQTYSHWELCLADGSDDKHADVGETCKALAEKDSRIKYKKLEKNLGISENTNACIDMASGDYIALFDHDDILHPAALYEFMTAICEKGADFMYTDEATFESPNLRKVITLHHKPEFSLDNLRANNYICHFSAFSREVLEKAGRFRKEFDGSQDHDMILRLTENAKCIVRIPKILYYWRSHPLSVAMDINSKKYAIDAGRAAVRESIKRDGMDAEVESSRAFPTIYRIRYAIPQKKKVSIIIPNKDHYKDLKTCLDSIFALTTYPNYEIIIVDNGSTEANVFHYYDWLQKAKGVKVLSLDIPFNYPRLNNFAAEAAEGDYLLFLNNDIKIITPAWIEEMVMYAQREDVGAVGAMLYYPDNTIQHAGIVLGLGAHRVAGHIFHKCRRNDIGYMGRLCFAQNLSAVTAACMLVPAKVFREVGGFDESFSVAYNDVDLCLRIRQSGKRIVWTPHAEAYHYESQTRGYDDATAEKRKRFDGEVALFKERWSDLLLQGDPCYNPHFSLDYSDYRVV